MATCNHCGATIVFGGKREGNLRFCNEKCRDSSVLLAASSVLPTEFIAERTREVHQGDCPKCGGPGPVDVHTSHTLWSALVVTTWHSKPQMCCHSCGRKAKLRAMLSTGVFGWWGFPWGLIGTPIQIFRNISGMFSSPSPHEPSPALHDMVSDQLAQQLAREDRLASQQ